MYNAMNQPGGGLYGQTNINPYPQFSPMGPQTMYTPNIRNVLPGRTIDKVEDVVVGEIPNDGSVAVFLQKDGNSIYTKSWNSDGTIRTMKFVPAEQNDSAPSRQESVQQTGETNPLAQEINEKLDDILGFLTSSNNYERKSGTKNQNGSDSVKEN